MLENLKTIFLEFKILKKDLYENIQRLTNERLLGIELMKKHSIITDKPDPILLEKYKDLIEEININRSFDPNKPYNE